MDLQPDWTVPIYLQERTELEVGLVYRPPSAVEGQGVGRVEDQGEGQVEDLVEVADRVVND